METYTLSSNLTLPDILLIVTYLVACLLIGLSKMNYVKNIRNYALGNTSKRIPTVLLTATIFSTYVGARIAVGSVGRVYETGLVYGLAQLTRPLFWLVTGAVFAGRIAQFKGCMSLSDVMEKMYGSCGKWAINILSFPISCGIIAAQVLAMGTMFEYFLGTSHIIGILSGMFVLIVYSTFGGVRAVIMTDFFQFIILFIALPICAYITYQTAGGWEMIASSIPETHRSIDWSNGSNVAEFSSFVMYCLVPCTVGAYMQRFLISGDAQQIRRTMKINVFLTIPITVVVLVMGLALKSLVPDLARADTAMFYAIDNFLPAGLRGLVIAGILAVIMSTADSWLNATGVLFAHDIAKKLIPSISDKVELFVARLASAGIGIVAIFIALSAKSLLDLLWSIDNFWEPMILVPLVAGFMGVRLSKIEFVCGMVAGGSMVIISAHTVRDGYDIVTLCIGVISNLVGVILARLLLRLFSSNDKDDSAINLDQQGALNG